MVRQHCNGKSPYAVGNIGGCSIAFRLPESVSSKYVYIYIWCIFLYHSSISRCIFYSSIRFLIFLLSCIFIYHLSTFLFIHLFLCLYLYIHLFIHSFIHSYLLLYLSLSYSFIRSYSIYLLLVPKNASENTVYPQTSIFLLYSASARPCWSSNHSHTDEPQPSCKHGCGMKVACAPGGISTGKPEQVSV